MRISIDLDGTIFKTYERLARAFQIHFKKTQSLIELVTGHGLTDEEREWVYHHYFDLDIAYIGLPVYKDAIPVIQSLAKHHEIYFVSGRPLKFLHLTGYELAKHKLPIDNLFLVPRDKKISFILDLKPDIVIEDEYPIVYELASRGITAIILEREWNVEWLDTFQQPITLIRVKDWLTIREIIELKSKKGGE
ncbi:MAG: hypothetical protein QW051_01230 [Candidatus Aenigmatarchaeota archaeon]